jgi:hypothetical protein
MLLLNCAEQGNTLANAIKAKATMLLTTERASFEDTISLSAWRKRLPEPPYLVLEFVKNVVGGNGTFESRIRFSSIITLMVLVLRLL